MIEPTSGSSTRVLDFHFNGSGWEYFKIWIVNLIITLFSFGLLLPWARLRTRQYFYGNTELDGSAFSYCAPLMKLLIGWWIALLILFIAQTSVNFSAAVYFSIWGLIVLLLPAIIVRSMAFRRRYSLYRNIPFRFYRNYPAAYIALYGPVLFGIAIILLGMAITQSISGDGRLTAMVAGTIYMVLFLLLFPYGHFLLVRFYISQTRYGTSPFQYEGGAWGFYKLYILLFLVWLVVIVAMMIINLFFIGASVHDIQHPDGLLNSGAMMILPLIFAGAGLLLGAFFTAFYKARLFNLVYSNTVLTDQHGLSGEMKVGYLTWLYVSNTIAMAITLGLFTPWAKVRVYRYKLQSLQFIAAGNLGLFVAGQKEEVSALADEFSAAFDIPIGL